MTGDYHQEPFTAVWKASEVEEWQQKWLLMLCIWFHFLGLFNGYIYISFFIQLFLMSCVRHSWLMFMHIKFPHCILS